jgi:cytochrome c-type biogenesis protein CcmH/NrfG
MQKAIQLNPDDLDAREGLMRYYAQAPWPLGSNDQAKVQAGEIARRNPARGVREWIRLGRIFEKEGDTDAARAAYTAALQIDPKNDQALQASARLP